MIEQTKPNRMERRRLKTRGKLLDATLQLVTSKGIAKTTMDDITEAADLGRRTLYYHFSSKEECIQAAITGTFQEHAAKAASLISPSEDAAVVVATAARIVIGALIREPVTAKLVDHPKLLAAILVDSVGRFAHRDIELGIARGRFRAPSNWQVMDHTMIWSLVGLIIHAHDGETGIDTLIATYSEILLMMFGIDGDEASQIVSSVDT